MLMIRLQRVGRKNIPTFRVVLTDKRNSTKSGKYLEALGAYDPRQGGIKQFKADKIKYWISQGAKPSGTLWNLLVNEKIIKGKKINVLPGKSSLKKGDKDAVKSEAKSEEKSDKTTSASVLPTTEPPKPEGKIEEKKEAPAV